MTRVAGGVSVTGWAIDPSTLNQIEVDLWFYQGSLAYGYNLGPANTNRPDVGAAYPFWGPNRGFNATVGFDIGGTWLACAWAINQGAGGNVQLGCKYITISNDPVGSLDTVQSLGGDGAYVGGWTLDPDTTAPLETDVWMFPAGGGQNVGFNLGPSSLSRPDIVPAYPSWGPNHGYAATLHTGLSGRYLVCAYGINQGAGGNVQLGCGSADFTRVVGSSLALGGHLGSGEEIVSSDGSSVLAMQDDGNLVWYVQGEAVYNSGTSGSPGATATLGTDGNMVVSLNGTVLYSSGPGTFSEVAL